jgi:phage regulator Rha-like protein
MSLQFKKPDFSAKIQLFTEKGFYMLATILKSSTATQTTIAIVEAFAKLRELARNVAELAKRPEETKQKTL